MTKVPSFVVFLAKGLQCCVFTPPQPSGSPVLPAAVLGCHSQGTLWAVGTWVLYVQGFWGAGDVWREWGGQSQVRQSDGD